MQRLEVRASFTPLVEVLLSHSHFSFLFGGGRNHRDALCALLNQSLNSFNTIERIRAISEGLNSL